MLAGDAAATAGQDESGSPLDPGKFAPVELSSHFNASASDFGPREQARDMGGPSQQDGLIHTPSGKQNFRGIPFLLGSEGSQAKSWVVLSQHRDRPWGAETVEIDVDQKAGSICLAQFCDWDPNETPIAEQDVYEQVGQHLSDIVFVYDDGREEAMPIRRRFEVNAPSVDWGHLSFAALAHTADAPSPILTRSGGSSHCDSGRRARIHW
jgi:hypothetical protein